MTSFAFDALHLFDAGVQQALANYARLGIEAVVWLPDGTRVDAVPTLNADGRWVVVPLPVTP